MKEQASRETKRPLVCFPSVILLLLCVAGGAFNDCTGRVWAFIGGFDGADGA
jgi:hypothetical protein